MKRGGILLGHRACAASPSSDHPILKRKVLNNRIDFFPSILLFLGAAGLSAADRTVDLTFSVLSGSETSIEIDLDPGSLDTDTITYSGSLDARITYDDSSLKPKSIQFTGGNLAASDTDLSFGGNIYYEDAGRTVDTSFRLRTSGVSATIETSGSGGIDEDNRLNPDQHRIRIDQGYSRIEGILSGYGSESLTQFYASENQIDDLYQCHDLSLDVCLRTRGRMDLFL